MKKLTENRHLVERKEERRVVKQEPEVERELLIQPLKCAEHWGGRKRQYNSEGNGTSEREYRLCRDRQARMKEGDMTVVLWRITLKFTQGLLQLKRTRIQEEPQGEPRLAILWCNCCFSQSMCTYS